MSRDGQQLTRPQAISAPECVPLPHSRSSSPAFVAPQLGAQQNRSNSSTPTTAVLLQARCYQHRYIREKDTSGIVERPERLRAVACGLAVAISRLEGESNLQGPPDPSLTDNAGDRADILARALSHLSIDYPPAAKSPVCEIIHSDATVDILSNPAVRFIHARERSSGRKTPIYLKNLKSWALSSEDSIAAGASEIPEGLPQGDLYLSPGSIEAMEGAIGTVCEAIDVVVSASVDRSISRQSSSDIGVPTSLVNQNHRLSRAFAVIRPPGHHCGEDTPSGFCFVNNVAVGAAHAYLNHGIDRVAILDIDLHHGNGTQKIAWTINEDTHRTDLENRDVKRGLKVFYGSLHDILSYPCEDGDVNLVRDASVSLHNAHGQFIENIHLESYVTEDDFHSSLYSNSYNKLVEKARSFFQVTKSSPENSLIIISCGFDACEHEYPSMSRHNRKVPVSFYERFATDVRALAEEVSRGRVVSVLEGGYSDKALTSGAMAHLAGLAGNYQGSGTYSWNRRGEWWSADNLNKIERATKLSRKTRNTISSSMPYGGPTQEPWLVRGLEIFSTLDRMPIVYPVQSRISSPPQSNQRMTLRERKKPGAIGSASQTPTTSPEKSSRPSPSKTSDNSNSMVKKPRKSGGGRKSSPQMKTPPMLPISSNPETPQDEPNMAEETEQPPNASENRGKDVDLTQWRHAGDKFDDNLVEASRTKGREGSGEHTTDPPITIKIRIPRQNVARVDKDDA